ncbi:hypothetical protein MHYP_G00276770 [Metynnis hypsauchen]
MSCLWFWCCRGQQSDSDTENKANDEQLKNGGKIKKKKKWRTRKRKEHRKKEQTMDEEKAENIQASQQPAAGEEESDAPLIPAGLVSGSLENISAVIPEKTGTPLHEDAQTSEDVPEASGDLKDTSLDQIEAEAEAEAITTLMCTDPEEQEANNQPLENVELMMTTAEAEAEAIEQLMNIYLDQTEDSMEQHLAGDEMLEATLTEAEVEAVKQLMLLFVDRIEAESLGCEVMSAAETEAEASGLNRQTHLDEAVTPSDHPLDVEKTRADHSLGNEMDKVTDAEAEADDLENLMDVQLDETDATAKQGLGKDVEISTDPEPIKDWADIIDEIGGTTNQSAETKTLKDFPGNEAKPNQQKRKTRRGTRGKGRKINYKKGPRREE